MLQLAAYRSGAVITTPSSLDGRVTVVARDAPVGELVAALAATRGLSLACEGTGELVALWDPISTVPDPGPCTSIPVEGLDLPECSPSSRPSTPWGSYAKKARVITSPEMDDDQLDAVLEAALGGTLTREPGACARRTVSEPWLLLQPWSPTTEGCGAPETSERPLRRDGTQRGTEGHPDRPTPLQLWPVSDFRLTATVARGDEVFGLVEDPTGTSHRVEVGSFIGPEWAKVTSLSPLEMELTVRYTTFEGEDVDVRSVVKLPLR